MQLAPSDIHVVILAGAQSARIRPLSLERPKTLVPVCNQPILKRLLMCIVDAGLSKATLSLPLLWAPMDREIMALSPDNFDFRIARPEGLFKGTVRDIVRMVDSDARSVLVISGDSLLSADLASLIEAHSRTLSHGGVATILYHRPHDLLGTERDGRTYHGVLAVDESGRVVRFVEKPNVSMIEPGFDLANAAVFICEKTFLNSPGIVDAQDFSYGVFEPTVGAKTPIIFACDIGDGYRIDVGTVKRFFDTNMRMLAGDLVGNLAGNEVSPGIRVGRTTRVDGIAMRPPVLIGEQVTFSRDVEIGPNVIVGDLCVLGDRARVENSIFLERCVIGSNTKLNGTILGTGCRIEGGQTLEPFTVIGAYSSIDGRDWPYSFDSDF